MTTKRIFFAFAFTACFSLFNTASHADVLTRTAVIANASAYANLTWLCSKKNAKKDYNILKPGKRYRGMPYNWGGFDSPDKFIYKVNKGAIAGNYKKRCGRHLCLRPEFAGLDCSGLVSRSWGISRYTTKSFPGISIKIPWEMLQPGDILNSKNKHVMLFDKFDDDNQVWVYESSVGVSNKKAPPAGVIYRSVDMDDDYTPRRYYKFIERGERVRADKTIIALYELKGRKKFYVSTGTTGEIMTPPTIRSKARKRQAPSDVWVYIKFSNGKAGWVTIRHLSLIAANA